MCTACLLTVSQHALCRGGVCLPRGCLPGGVSASGLAGVVNMTLVNSFVLMLKIYLCNQWRFRGAPSLRAPLRPKIFSISSSFSQNLAQNHMLVPPCRGWRPLLRKILDPPLLTDFNTCYVIPDTKQIHDKFVRFMFMISKS